MPQAQVAFAMGYIVGLGTKQDPRCGFDLLMKYADEGNAEAQFELGNLYAEGELLEQDWQKAAMWWMNAAERDHHLAQLKIGQLFLAGRGVKRDKKGAFKYLFLACYAKVPGADEAMDQLSGQFAADELETSYGE
jgi:TPR repeat protein